MPCAFVELKEGAKATEAEIIAFCRSHMSGFKTPKAVVFGPIPKTSTGKIQKFLLRDQVELGEGDFGVAAVIARSAAKQAICPSASGMQ